MERSACRVSQVSKREVKSSVVKSTRCAGGFSASAAAARSPALVAAPDGLHHVQVGLGAGCQLGVVAPLHRRGAGAGCVWSAHV